MDIYSEITNRIINEMEVGVIPWQKPWVASGGCVSYATGKPYSLLNQMLLGAPGEYATFKQIRQAGGYVRKGEKAHMVVFWKWLEKEDEETGEMKSIPFLRYYNVFHISQRRLLRLTLPNIALFASSAWIIPTSPSSAKPSTPIAPTLVSSMRIWSAT